MNIRSARRFAPAVAIVATLVLAPAAASTGRYVDVTGDSGAAPDINGVTVASDAGGQIVLTVGVVDLPSPADVQTLVVLDTDQDGTTGAPGTAGGDYAFVVDESDDSYGFAHWTGTDWDWDTPYATVSVYSRHTGVMISVNRSELGDTSGFNFWSRSDFGDDESDVAPDEGLWNYSLAAGGPEIRGVMVATKPASGPKAGKAFSLTPLGLKLPESAEPSLLVPQPDSYSCRATLGGRAFAGHGRGGCTWTLPKSARKKSLTVVVTVEFQGATKDVSFAYRVS